jgi:pimeloyl-ACP methyl ester carboxylesterase
MNVAYEIVGHGPALLLLHAFPLDRRMWRETAASLADRYRVISFDFRGFGESPMGDGPASLERWADDAAALLDTAGVPIASVAGLSMGGYVALAFAARHPARLGALVLGDTRAGADSPEGKKGRDDGIALVRSRGAAAFVDPMPGRLLSARASEELKRRVRELGGSQAPEAIAGALAAMRDRPDRTGELGAIACPALVMVGSDDALTPPAEARAMARAIPGCKLVELAGAGHLANLEAPDAFTRALGDFLDAESPVD